MNYQFSFNKRSSVLILAAGSLAGAVLFAAGYLVGFHRGAGSGRLEVQQQLAAQTSSSEPSTPPTLSTPSTSSNVTASAEPATPATQPAAPASETQASSASTPSGDDAPAPTPSLASLDPSASDFCVQVGTFLTEDGASPLQVKLASRGYSVYVFKGQDSTGKTWFAVRLGHFKDLQAATRAAVTFTLNERMPAHVRAGNAL